MSSYSNNKPKTSTSMEGEIDLKRVYAILGRYKTSIFLSILVMTLLAIAYAFFSTSVYQATLTLQVRKQASKGSGSSGQDAFMQEALGAEQNNIDDEITILESASLTNKALKYLQLGTRYYTQESLKTIELYKSSPFRVETKSLYRSMLGYKFYIKPIDTKSFRLTVVPPLRMKILSYLGAEQKPLRFSKVFTYGTLIKQPQFSMLIKKTGIMTNEKYFFTVVPNEWMTNFILSSLNISVLSQKGSILILSYQDNVPQRALDVLTAIANAYKNRSIEMKNKSANKKLAFIDRQLAQINKSLQKSANSLQKYKSSHVVIDLKTKGVMLSEKISTLETQVSQLDLQKSVLKNLEKQIKARKNLTNIDISSARFVGSPLSSLIEKLQLAYRKHVSLAADYTKNHPYVKTNNQQIESIIKSLLGTIESNIQGNNQQKSILSNLIKKNKAELESIPKEQKDLASLTNNFSVNKKLYEYLLQKRAETAIVESSKVSSVRVIDEAGVGEFPVKPKRLLLILVGMFLGVILGVVQALFRNRLANTIQSISDIQKHTSLPIYAVLPFFKNKKSLYEDSLRVLLTKLEVLRSKPKVIVITSSIEGEGRTTTTVEFAKVIAQSNRKVVMIDFDLRHPKTYKKPKLSSDIGMSTLLSGENTIEEVVQNLGTNIDIITAGPVPSNPHELFMSKTLDTVMSRLREKYDYIIIDSPATGLVADALVLMHLADLNLIVFKAKYSKIDFIDNINRFVSEHELKNVGIVLNALELKNIRPWFKK